MSRAAVLALALVAGCTAGPRPRPPAAPFSHEAFDQVLARFVDGEGRVDYAGLKAAPVDLDRYRAALASVSPDSHPRAFPTANDRLAYWINAYNASVIGVVVAHYPIASVADVRGPFGLLPRLAGFFLFQPVTLGGRRVSLHALEHRIIRRRFGEPRVHFALNCAARGCPQLPRRAFSAAALEDELEHETRVFFAEARNLTVDPATRSIFLSSILDWYETDFVRWQRARGAPPELLAYVTAHLSAERSAAVAACAGCRLRFEPYDWRLNDQRALTGTLTGTLTGDPEAGAP